MNDKEKLRDLIQRLMQVLNAVVQAREVLFPRGMRDRLEAAWDELQQAGTTDSILVEIARAQESKLTAAGLTGSQLELKYAEFRLAHLRFVRRGGLKALKDVLGWANVVLPSLSVVINVSEPIKELKDAIEKALERA